MISSALILTSVFSLAMKKPGFKLNYFFFSLKPEVWLSVKDVDGMGAVVIQAPPTF